MRDRLVVSDSEVMGGIPVFTGTRVPVRALFESLAGGSTLDEILDDYPTIGRERAVETLRWRSSCLNAPTCPTTTARSTSTRWMAVSRRFVRPMC
jgi:uncharacterized protein (DUF433 family)